jgi:hypothetical protein
LNLCPMSRLRRLMKLETLPDQKIGKGFIIKKIKADYSAAECFIAISLFISTLSISFR